MKKISLFLLASCCFLMSFSQALDSLDIKIGQMIMVGMPGNSVDASSPILKNVEKGIVGGILLFEYNINPVNSEKNIATLCNRLQDAAKIPLLISIDQEGGQVNRLKTKYGFPAMPSAKSVGLINNDQYTRQVARTISTTLMKCGINLNYAPVLDLHNPNCPVLGKRGRCYSSDYKQVAHMAQLTIEEHHALGIKTALKHFPGHGNSLSDSHLGMADVTKVWKQEELEPYRMLINEGVADMVMMAHIVNRKLDSSGLPASLSEKIVHDVLRNQLGFKGVVITDDMQMHAISNYYGLEQSIKLAINAGVDIVMFSNNIKGASNYNPANIHATIKRLVKNGTIPMSRINESYERILRLKMQR
ncbi:MAG TPA: glycoside hydrolase family 3 protein [Chitinophagaceae bacterium]|nr:glycoside hydrolase family 3 protein [Chitinophagaceae bacterium]